MTTDSVLELQQVRRSFPLQGHSARRPRLLHAVREVSLQVRRGEVFALVGESGCGKSTLARIMLGLDRPSGGAVALAGRPVGGIAPRDRAALVQPVFQDPHSSLNPRRTVGQIIAMPLDVHGIGLRSERRARVAQAMADVGLSPALVHHYPGQLSGGQRQRVAIARALMLEPLLLVCDEPTSALDVSVQAQILNLLLELHRSRRQSLVLISHNLSVVRHMADRVAVMYFGRVVESGPAADVFARPRHPYTRALLDADPNLAGGFGRLPRVVSGELPNPTDTPTGCAFHSRCERAQPRCAVQAPALDGQAQAVACHFPLASTTSSISNQDSIPCPTLP